MPLAATGSLNGTLAIWDIPSQKLRHSCSHPVRNWKICMVFCVGQEFLMCHCIICVSSSAIYCKSLTVEMIRDFCGFIGKHETFPVKYPMQ